MKTYTGTILCLLIALNGACAPSTNITVRIVDEAGGKIPQVATTIVVNGQAGRNKYEKVTDTNGLCSVMDRIPARISIGAQKEGYYKSLDDFYFIPDNGKSGIEPWGGRTIILREIIEPKIGKNGSTRSGKSWIEIPAFNISVGFDILESDWVAPYGNGKVADFVFTFSKNTEQRVFSYVLTFSNERDGIAECQFSKVWQSVFQWPYKAPLDGYASVMERMTGFNRSKASISPEKKIRKQNAVNYIFRIRTELDDEGNIKSALYGKISGEIALSTKPKDELRFSYWLNTDPLSRSLESTDPYLP